METLDDLHARLRPWIDEIATINQHYAFRPSSVRSDADNARVQALFGLIKEARAAYNAAHPTAPCPACGGERPADLGGECVRIGRCPEAPAFLGG